MNDGTTDKATPALRMTRQRRVILEELKRCRTHPTARQIYDRVRRRLPSVSLGTVYRNLEVLCGRGTIRALELARPLRHYDSDIAHHYHLCCIRCGRVDDAPISPISDLEEALGEASGYAVVGHRIEFSGICPRCRSPEDAPRGERS